MPLRNLDNAFTNFFKGRGKFPRFKRKTNGGSFHVPQHGEVDFKQGLLFMPKFVKKNALKIRFHRRYKGEIKTVTVSRTPIGKYFATILVDTRVVAAPKKPISKPVGIKDFAILSIGEKIANPKHLKNSIERLKVLSRRASKNQKGSAKQKKAFARVARLHEKISNQRQDLLQKLSTDIIKNHDNIAIEDLGVANMVKNHKLAQAISDVSWGMF